MADSTLLTPADIAARTGRKVRTVQQWITRNGLPARRVGPAGFYVIDDEEFRHWWDEVGRNIRRGRPRSARGVEGDE